MPTSPSREVAVDATKVELVSKPLLASAALNKFSGYHFNPSSSGVDSNLLILLHGLGDNDSGFFNLGQNLQKTLPQTAILTLQAPLKVPFLEGDHWMWYPAFDQFAELLTKPNPTVTVASVVALLDHLVGKCGWSAGSIHIFGFGQGATLALEVLISWSKSHSQPLGSIVSIHGSFISHPTISSSSTPVLHIYRSAREIPLDSTRWSSHRKSTSALTLHRLRGNEEDESMLKGSEWDSVMSFWSKFFRNRIKWELEGKVVPIG
ncbi:uncharacterized protein UMAG_10204 [Mycosarcoma maydis]|uniref:Uncharacterized hydrolase UM10204 n=1 Tax=Mycosarcoma maydis TaxID=5270 RepID=YU204_MYCMD|nr:uncharacterized protein UMAG_10204 [Ustilago maydis 521]P0CT29.1 RecName: Full=Uncharacterized hydrolase UM10204 [Ustilago maydis 521]KIS66361.1 hypothetical protein UMAG_10204 [Ustilago maydis 521]|eukprot:XP_011392128.1 hypothetical protein UMAG_10204 [Ustilago maydis 521]